MAGPRAASSDSRLAPRDDQRLDGRHGDSGRRPAPPGVGGGHHAGAPRPPASTGRQSAVSMPRRSPRCVGELRVGLRPIRRRAPRPPSCRGPASVRWSRPSAASPLLHARARGLPRLGGRHGAPPLEAVDETGERLEGGNARQPVQGNGTLGQGVLAHAHDRNPPPLDTLRPDGARGGGGRVPSRSWRSPRWSGCSRPPPAEARFPRFRRRSSPTPAAKSDPGTSAGGAPRGQAGGGTRSRPRRPRARRRGPARALRRPPAAPLARGRARGCASAGPIGPW